MMPIIRSTMALVAVVLLSAFAVAQPLSVAGKPIFTNEGKPGAKPYRLLTAGKQITLKSTKEIKSVLVWTASGHRILEQREVNASYFNFKIEVNEKLFFLMIQLGDGKVYTEKIGI